MSFGAPIRLENALPERRAEPWSWRTSFRRRLSQHDKVVIQPVAKNVESG